MKAYIHNNSLYMNVHGSFINNSPKLEITQMTTTKRRDFFKKKQL